jgi:asparagine synthase (glutamine-hydrolysing)
MLAGDGGDELFGGNERYVKQKVFDYYALLPAALRRAVIEPVAAAAGRVRGIAPLWKLHRYVSQARAPAGARAGEVFNQLKGMSPAFIFEPALLGDIDCDLPARELQATFDAAPAHANLDRMLYLDWKITLADNDLRKVNRMCELAGLRVRYPMLDDAVVELSTRIPARMKIRGRKLRDFYKRAFADFLPREIIFKHKHGFGLPFGEWLKSEPVLRDLTYPALERLKDRGIYRAECIDTLVRTHRDGHASYYGGMVWALLMLELWLEEHAVSL